MKNHLAIAIVILVAFCACTNSPKIESVSVGKDTVSAAPTSNPQPPTSKKEASAAEIMARPQVPILCYHRIRPFKPSDSKRAKAYIVTPEDFRAQMKLLADSGYKTILADQLMNYLQYGDPIPEKAVMLTFDDNVGDQMTVAEPIL
ncbi:MAG: hypothetical protein ACK458_18650 [Sphingobacteriales bacterium]